MKIFTLLYQAILICIGISIILVNVKAKDPKRLDVADTIPKCQQFQTQYDALKADNKNLTFFLEKMEKILQEQLQQENEIEKDLHEFEMKVMTLETLLLQQQNDHHKVLKDTINSMKTRKFTPQNGFRNDFQKFSKLQHTISKKFNILREIEEISSPSNDLSDDVTELEPTQQDNESFCSNLYEETLDDLGNKIEILQNINAKLEKGSEKFINESNQHLRTIEELPHLLEILDEKDEPEVCVRTKDKTAICSNQPHPTSCEQYDSPHCSQGKCLIKNFIYGPEPFLVPCDQIHDGGGWIVIQRRINGSMDFYRNWSDYKLGFGHLDGEFWLGLDKIHALTVALAPMELLIQLTDHRDITKYAKFSEFLIGNETELYELEEAKGYEGNAGDSFSLHKGQKFTTWDKDNDASYSYNCAVEFTGAWWYNNCFWSNLNGLYYKPSDVRKSGRCVCWNSLRGENYPLKFVQMMIRPRKEVMV